MALRDSNVALRLKSVATIQCRSATERFVSILNGIALKAYKHVALLPVGELHQPLHIECSYFDADNYFFDSETGASDSVDAPARMKNSSWLAILDKSSSSDHPDGCAN